MSKLELLVRQDQEDEKQNTYVVPPVVIKKKPVYSAIKRGVAIIVALCAEMLLTLQMLVFSTLIRLDLPGPVLFRQERN